MGSMVPTRTLAGISVPDSPIVNSAINVARSFLAEDWAFNHVMRSWLFSMVVASKRPDADQLDLEVISVTAILHDLGWNLTSPETYSANLRFEVDSANFARNFLKGRSRLRCGALRETLSTMMKVLFPSPLHSEQRNTLT